MNFLLEAKGRPREVQAWSWLALVSGCGVSSKHNKIRMRGWGAGKAWTIINTDIHPNSGNQSQLNGGLGLLLGAMRA